MRHTFSEKAYAKINLTLDVTGQRGDGYHTIETVMHTVSLYDRVLVRRREEPGIVLSCNLPYLPRDGRNLAVRAAQAFLLAAGLGGQGLDICIKKRIPVGAGLAGGSTDAAAVLRVLDRMYGSPIPYPDLLELALSLGADVPFCMKGGAAVARGIGELLQDAPALPECWIVLCKPPVSVSTRAAYALLDGWGELEHPAAAPAVDALERGDLRGLCKALGNSFQQPIEKEKPIILKIRQELLRSGAQGALMSGSGSAVFGIFEDQAAAREAARRLSGRYRDTHLAQPVARIG